MSTRTPRRATLWGGLPVLTRAGRTFAARVGASLVSAVGLPELVTDSDADYEARALATGVAARAAGRTARAAGANRLTHPLFDTKGYTARLETAYRAA
jgi:predicted O-linked N-acetylglucosamine transferase (SPINDLY family)